MDLPRSGLTFVGERNNSMADTYIDLDETQIYGPYAVRQIGQQVKGLVVALDPALDYLMAEVEHVTQAVAAATRNARKASAGRRAGAKAKGPALKLAVSALGRFSTHLDSHPARPLDRLTFFPEDGTAAGVGKNPTRVLVGLGRIAGELEKTNCPVRDRETWLTEITGVLEQLGPVVQHSQSAKSARAKATPEQAAAFQAWHQVYGAAKCVVEGVLRLAGSLYLMPEVFYDLAVPTGTKVTAPPVSPTPPTE